MRVICINVDKRNNLNVDDIPHPELGETVTVIDERGPVDDKHYQLQEYAYVKGYKAFYAASNFIPVSDIDETELVTEEFNEKYLVPAK